MPRSSPFDYLFILRPLILIPVWNFLLIGAYLAAGQGRFTADVAVGLIIYTMVMGGVYILNQIMDIETDRLNKKLYLLAEGLVTMRAAYIELALLWGGAIVLALRFGPLFVAFILLSMVLGIMYSVPPVKLKGKPVLDTLANGLGYGTINFAVGWLLVRGLEPGTFIRFLPYVLSISAVFINTTLVDIEGDHKAGELTTGVLLGPKASHAVSTLIMAVAIVLAYIGRDYVCLVPAAVSFPLFVYGAVYALVRNRIHRKVTIASFRLPGLIFTLITAFLFPWYVILLLGVLVGMRVYYKQRFGMTYPTLAGG